MTFFKRFRFLPAAALAVLAIISCDDDFTNIGGGLVGGQLDNLPKYEAGIVAYNQVLDTVQTNNLPAHLLGVYQEPIYGQQVANVLTQLSLSAENPTFGNQPVLDSVVLSLPYFSTQLENDEDGNAVYRLDSIYGNSPYKLTVSRSNLFLNEFDPNANFETRQRYYSTQGPIIENSLIGEPIYINESFLPSANEVTYRGRNAENAIDTMVVAPRLRAHLPTRFFQENILNKVGSPELSTNNTFRNFIRGLYFQAEPLNGDGNMMLLNFNHQDAGIILYYKVAPNEEDEDEEEENLQRSFRLSFGPSIVNTFEQELPPDIAAEIETSNEAPGAENLFLKGGEGSMAIIELFEDDVELADLKSRNWLINEASLTFQVNQQRVPGGRSEPERLYLYNLDNNQLLVDYRLDPTLTIPNATNAVVTHSRPLVRDEDGNGLRYKIRITEHVRQILNGDAENVRLGLVVIQNILQVNNAATPNESIRRVPTGTVITPKGTILHGNLAPDESKRLKFEIFYTEIDN